MHIGGAILSSKVAKKAAPLGTTQERIIAAATRCFARKGMTKTSMADIAREARCSRTTVYRTFPDRAAMLEAILTFQFIETIRAMKEKFRSAPSLADALSTAPVYCIELLRRDPKFQMMIDSLGPFGYNMILKPSDVVRRYASSVWGPWFAKARARGELKSNLSDDRVLDGLLGLAGLLLLQAHPTDDERRAFMRDFLVTAVT